jgi:xanthine dehydrogenase iron-sulfur cluster and FAD-binding subunit A
MNEKAIEPHPMTNTHILLHEFEYLEPPSLAEALRLLKEYGGRAQVLAGGTNLLVQMKMEKIAPSYMVNVSRLEELEGFASRDGQILIGARASIRACRNQSNIRANYSALADACDAFGSTQIQMMGTIGGNLCNGSPASDAVPALMALDAQLRLLSLAGERMVSVEEFLLGPGKTVLQSDELLTSIILPPPKANAGSAFLKLSRVQADLAKVSVAAVLVRQGETIADCRLALGSVAPTVMRAKEAEATLIGQDYRPELALEAGKVASQEIAPIDDTRSSIWYRREVVKALVHDVLQVAWERSKRKPIAAEARPMKSPLDRDMKIEETLRIKPSEKHLIRLIVNGEKHELWVKPNELLLNVLRERLQLTGTKYGCGIGECGACTVRMDGMPALACLVLAVSADGRKIQTVEGLQASDGKLDPLQEAFIEHKGFQCGYCTPGIIVMSRSLLDEIPSPTEEDIRSYLRGNRCRCTGYTSIVRAVMNTVEGNISDK